MKIVGINMVSNGSTGSIMLNISKMITESGNEAKTFSTPVYTRGRKRLPIPPENHSYFGSRFENMIHTALAQFTGLNGCFSNIGTRKLIRECKKFKPDVIHLHNLHAFCINLPMLFKYIKNHRIPVVWTLHDCWAFTGHCPHFVMANCDKWKTECHKCPQLSVYPKSRVDNTKMAHRLKKKWFTDVENMTIVAPSKWLADLASESFLSEYTIKVINNGIDLSVFTPTASDFRQKYDLENKKIVLGVASGWGKRKGLDVFTSLAERLGNEYQVVLVGLNRSAVDNNIIAIPRTSNQAELAEIYSAADVFVNPTREDTFPTVNIEALACGTPVITFKTGGSPEIIDDSCGCSVDVDDTDTMASEIIRICKTAPYSAEACVNRAKGFDMYERFEDYISLYREVIDK